MEARRGLTFLLCAHVAGKGSIPMARQIECQALRSSSAPNQSLTSSSKADWYSIQACISSGSPLLQPWNLFSWANDSDGGRSGSYSNAVNDRKNASKGVTGGALWTGESWICWSSAAWLPKFLSQCSQENDIACAGESRICWSRACWLLKDRLQGSHRNGIACAIESRICCRSASGSAKNRSHESQRSMASQFWKIPQRGEHRYMGSAVLLSALNAMSWLSDELADPARTKQTEIPCIRDSNLGFV